VKNQKDLINAGKQGGYLNRDKLMKHLDEWMNLERDVPLGFLRAIGADTDEIFNKLEADKAEFESFKDQILCGGNAVIRLGPAVYRSIEIPHDMEENECIDYVKKEITYSFNFVIHFGSVKSIWVNSKESPFTIFYEPELKIGKTNLLIKGRKPFVHYEDERMFQFTAKIFS
jgi:hypothetical protein